MTPVLNIDGECPISNCRRQLYGSENYRDLWCIEHGPVAREDRGEGDEVGGEAGGD